MLILIICCFSCHKTNEAHLASCSLPSSRSNKYFTADDFCPYPPSISVTDPLPVTNSQPLDHMSYFMDEYLMDFADNQIDTSDFYRRYMAGFMISKREHLVSHCGSNYTRNFNMTLPTFFGSLDTKDMMCLMLGFTPIVESASLFTDTQIRQSLKSDLYQNDTCFANNLNPEVLDYAETTNCMFSKLANAYHSNSNVKYPNCNSFNLTERYMFIVNGSIVENATDIYSGDFRVDGAVRRASDFSVVYRSNSFIDPTGVSEDDLVSRQFAPLREILGATIYYNNQVTIVLRKLYFWKY